MKVNGVFSHFVLSRLQSQRLECVAKPAPEVTLLTAAQRTSEGNWTYDLKMAYRSNIFAIASHWQLQNQQGESGAATDRVLSISNKLSMQAQLDESTLLKVRTDPIMRDADAVISVRISPEVEMAVCCGFNIKETDKATPDKRYKDPYMGINFDI